MLSLKIITMCRVMQSKLVMIQKVSVFVHFGRDLCIKMYDAKYRSTLCNNDATNTFKD